MEYLFVIGYNAGFNPFERVQMVGLEKAARGTLGLLRALLQIALLQIVKSKMAVYMTSCAIHLYKPITKMLRATSVVKRGHPQTHYQELTNYVDQFWRINLCIGIHRWNVHAWKASIGWDSCAWRKRVHLYDDSSKMVAIDVMWNPSIQTHNQKLTSYVSSEERIALSKKLLRCWNNSFLVQTQ